MHLFGDSNTLSERKCCVLQERSVCMRVDGAGEEGQQWLLLLHLFPAITLTTALTPPILHTDTTLRVCVWMEKSPHCAKEQQTRMPLHASPLFSCPVLSCPVLSPPLIYRWAPCSSHSLSDSSHLHLLSLFFPLSPSCFV